MKVLNHSAWRRVIFNNTENDVPVNILVPKSSFIQQGAASITTRTVPSDGLLKVQKTSDSLVIGDTMSMHVAVTNVKVHTHMERHFALKSKVDGVVTWRKTWCVLDGARVKILSDEDAQEHPHAILDLRWCRARRFELIECSGKTSWAVVLVMNEEEVAEYVFVAQSRAIIEEWWRCLNLAIDALVEWGQLNRD